MISILIAMPCGHLYRRFCFFNITFCRCDIVTLTGFGPGIVDVLGFHEEIHGKM